MTIQLLIICISCSNDRASDNARVVESAKSTSDTVTLDIPREENGELRSYYKLKASFERLIGLQSLEKGFDSLEIRIWVGQAMSDQAQLFTFANKGAAWTGELFDLKYNFGHNRDTIESIQKRLLTNSSPASGWDDFISRLSENVRFSGFLPLFLQSCGEGGKCALPTICWLSKSCWPERVEVTNLALAKNVGDFVNAKLRKTWLLAN